MNIFVDRGRSIHPFCSKVKRDPLQTECTDDRNSVALCNLIRHEFALPKEYQVGSVWVGESRKVLLLTCRFLSEL